MHRILASLLLAAILAAPLASAGSQDAPEVTDDEGDAECYAPAGNEWADVGGAWISDESATAFTVNIVVNKWTNDNAGAAVGYTLQFTHQDVQYGVAAAYVPAPFGTGWEYSNAFIDTETGEFGDFTDAEGSFTPGTPAILSIVFDKAFFPHGQAMDHTLSGFIGGSADFKNQVPFFIVGDDAPVPPPEFEMCDLMESDAIYTFTTGTHSMGSMAEESNATAMDHEAMGHEPGASASTESTAPLSTQGGGDKATPGLGILGAVLAIALVAALRRRRA